MLSKITSDKMINTASSETSWLDKIIPFMGGRPDRDLAIGVDDITNLVIACNTCRSLEELFQLL